MKTPLVYRDQPIFGFDLGSRTAKMIQLNTNGKHVKVLGYGYADFPAEALVEGIIVDPNEIATALKPLMAQMSYGQISARRVAISLPTGKVFTRMLQLPVMSSVDLAQAVRFEAEQYIPVPLADLYIDYEIIDQPADHIDVLMVAAPRAIVDSYLQLFDLLNLEVIFVQSSMEAVTRAIITAHPLTQATLVADFGSESIDLTIYDKVLRLTDTIAVGGDDLTATLVSRLGIEPQQATEIKYKFGVGPSGLQPKIMDALEPQLGTIVAEIKRVSKYYLERGTDQRPIETIVISGGSASMPGIVEYLTAQLGIKVQIANPWAGLVTKGIQSVSKNDAPMYTTAIGLALLEGQV